MLIDDSTLKLRTQIATIATGIASVVTGIFAILSSRQIQRHMNKTQNADRYWEIFARVKELNSDLLK